MSKNPTPDRYGRFRVRPKGRTDATAYSTNAFDPDRHVLVPGPASDIYGKALPPKRFQRLEVQDAPTPTEEKKN